MKRVPTKSLGVKKYWTPPRSHTHSALYAFSVIALVLGGVFFSLPTLLFWEETYTAPEARLAEFPITVDPLHETITEDPAAEALFAQENTPLTAAVANASVVFEYIGAAIASTPLYKTIAPDTPHFVTIEPGYRKEQVAAVFAKEFKWTKKVQAAFLKNTANNEPGLSEGTFSPGLYIIDAQASTSAHVQAAISNRFEKQILARYATSTREILPVATALTIASMIERETADHDEMRTISGIIWNRIFSGMKLQVDATLQYAKATGRNGWWPTVNPRDKYIKSPYNTYINTGLPPTPISNPSVAAVFAALNPKKTDCLFYFHDNNGGFHCSETYEAHVTSLKQYFGKGK